MSDMPQQPMSTFHQSGVLWYINRVAFHPRGFALAFEFGENDEPTSWAVLGDGSEVWTFKSTDDDEEFAKIERLLDGLK